MRKLNSNIWNNQSEFDKAYNTFLSMADKRYRYFPYKIPKNQWLSMTAIFDNSKHSKPKKKSFSSQHEYNSILSYKKYLDSDTWNELAKRIKRRAGNKCQVCNSPHNLHAHHRTYKNKGNYEKEKRDLICLCERCHKLIHDNIKIT